MPYFCLAAPPRIKTAALLAALLVSVWPGSGLAKSFYLERPRWSSKVDYRYFSDEQTTPDRQDQSSSHRLTEGLSVASSGWLYHPALLTFDVQLDPQWSQESEGSEDGLSSGTQSFSLGYGFNGTLLADHAYSMRLFARRGNSTVSASLAPTTTSESLSYGATLYNKSPLIPSQLTYTVSEKIQEGFYSSEQSTESLRLLSTSKVERHKSSLRADYEETVRSSSGLISNSENLSAQLNDEYQVTADRGALLRSAVQSRWMTSGAGDFTSLGLNESLTWRHTRPEANPSLTSSYSAAYTRYDREEGEDTSLPLNANLVLSHQLYENLTTALNTGVGHTTDTGGRANSYGGGLNFDYRRRVPFGMLALNLGQSYVVVDQVNDDGLIWGQEAQVLRDGDFTLLSQTEVDQDSVRVYNANQSVEYVRDFDFSVSLIDDFVQIIRLPSGAIVDGDTVQIEYQYQSDPSNTLGTSSRSFGGQLNLWSVFSLGYQYSRAQQDLLAGIPPSALTDDTSQVVTAALDYGWSKTNLSLEESQRSAGDSSQGWKITQSLSWRPKRWLFLNVNGNYGETALTDSDLSGHSYSVRSSMQVRITPRQQAQLEAYRTTSVMEPSSNLEYTGVGVGYTWWRGIWNFQLSYKYLQENQPLVEQESNNNTLSLTLRRALY